jgi:hypothetical protein
MRIVQLSGLILAVLTSVVSFADEEAPTYRRMWGTPGSGPGQFGASLSISADYWGDIYVGDADNDRIQEFTPFGDFWTQWGEHGAAPGEFDNPSGITGDGNTFVYVNDQGNGRVQKFTGTGEYETDWTSAGAAVAADDAACVYVVDTAQNRILKYDTFGGLLTIWGSAGSGPGQFNHPSCVAVGADHYVYVGDEGNHRIQRFYPTGQFIDAWGEAGSGPGQFGSALALASDVPGNVYVADGANHRVQKFTSSGDFLSQWGTAGTTAGEFGSSLAVSVDWTGTIFVADSENSRVQVFYPPSREVYVQSMPITSVVITGTAAGLTPFSAVAHTDSPVTLTAPSTAAGLGKRWYFVRWYVNNEAKADNQRTVTFPLVEGTSAIAYYTSVEELIIRGHTAVWQRSRADYSCTAHFDDGSVKNVTTSAKWREASAFLKILGPGRLWAGTVPHSLRRDFRASYGGVTTRFSVLIRNR